jgi:hypothetical protein
LLTLIRNVRAKRTHQWAKSGYNLG